MTRLIKRLIKLCESSLVKPSNRKLKRSIRSINDTSSDEITLTTEIPSDENPDNIDNIFDDKDLFPDDGGSFDLYCDDIEFECKSDHKCIPLDWYCNGQIDCDDESDEQTCATTPAIHFSIINETTTELATTTTTTTSTEKSTSVSPVDTETTKQVELNSTVVTTLKPVASTESNSNETTTTENPVTTTTVKVL